MKIVSRIFQDKNPKEEISKNEYPEKVFERRQTKTIEMDNERTPPVQMDFRRAVLSKKTDNRSVNLPIKKPEIESWEKLSNSPGDDSDIPDNIQRLLENNLEKWDRMSEKDSETLEKILKMRENGMRLDNYPRFLKFLVFAEAFQREIEMQKFDIFSVEITPKIENEIQLFQVRQIYFITKN